MTAPRRNPTEEQIPRELFEIVKNVMPSDFTLEPDALDFVKRVAVDSWSGKLAKRARFSQLAGGFLGELGSGEDDQGLMLRFYLFGVLVGCVGAIPIEDLAVLYRKYKEQQSINASHRRGPCAKERERRDKQIFDWDAELRTYPSGKARPRSERVSEIRRRCAERYRDLSAEAHSMRSKEKEAAAAVWKIGNARIIQLISPKKK